MRGWLLRQVTTARVVFALCGIILLLIVVAGYK